MNTMETTLDASYQNIPVETPRVGPVAGMEVIAVWNDVPQTVIHRGPTKNGAAEFSVGEDPACDFPIPREYLGGAASYSLVTAGEEGTRLAMPPGSEARVFHSDAKSEQISSGDRMKEIPLPFGSRALLDMGPWSFIVSSCAPPKPFAAKRGKLKPNMFTGFSILLHAAFFLSISLVPPDAKGLMLGSGMNDNRYTDYMIVPAEVKTQTTPDIVLQEKEDQPTGKTGKQAAGSEGAMGDRSAERNNNRYAIKGFKDNKNITMARDRMKEMAKTSGILNFLSAQNAPTSPFGSDNPMGVDAENALGALVGDQPGANFGYGGLGVHDTGRGGGGNGLGTLGVGNLARIGGLPGGAGGDTTNRRPPRLVEREPRTKIILKTSTQILGSIPKDVIRRHVRRQLPQIQHCYEKGLSKRPDLAGRVSIKFQISSNGSVTRSLVAGSSLGDNATEQCIARVVGRIQFPSPEDGGIVIATYPFTLQSSDR